MEGGFLTPRKSNAASMIVVIGLHGAVLTAVALSKMDMPTHEIFRALPTEFIPVDPVPPETPPEPQPQARQPTAPTVLKVVPPLVTLPSDPRVEGSVDTDPTPPIYTNPGATVDPAPAKTIDPPAPVRVAATIDPRFADQLQPPYPPSEQRMSNEGSVTVRVAIGADGRVTAVHKLSAASEAFYQATARQALGRWRFKPATIDGKPVASEKVMTVHFRLEE